MHILMQLSFWPPDGAKDPDLNKIHAAAAGLTSFKL